MLKRLIFIFLPLFALSASAVVFNPPSQNKITYLSVRDVLQDPVEDSIVKLQGKITKKVAHEKYEFNDGTGSIIIEVDDKRFPAEQVTEFTKIEIIGEIDNKRNRKPEIEVKYMNVLGPIEAAKSLKNKIKDRLTR